MTFPFESLPRTVLLEAFSYIDPEILLDLRFLNKNLFGLVGIIIQGHLRYSNYFNVESFNEVQIDFIIKNSSGIKRLIIKDDKSSDYLSKCGGIDNILTRFPNLNSLNSLNFDNQFWSLEILTPYKYVMYNVEYLDIALEIDFILDQLLLFLNPDKIKRLNINNQIRNITINDMMNFIKFIKLKELTIEGAVVTIIPNESINPDTVIFPSLKYLKIKISNFRGNLSMFGNIMQLKSLILLPPTHSKKEMRFIKQNNLLTNLCFEYNFLNNIGGDTFSIIERLEPLLKVECNSTIIFWGIDNNAEEYYSSYEDYDSIDGDSPFVLDNSVSENNEDNDNSAEANNSRDNISIVNDLLIQGLSIGTEGSFSDEGDEEILLFLYVHSIRFNYCALDVKFISKLLKHFPNAKKILFDDCEFTNNKGRALSLPSNNEDYLICMDQRTLKSEYYPPFKLFEGFDIMVIN